MARKLKDDTDKVKRVMLTLSPNAIIILDKEKRNKSRFVSELLEIYGDKLLRS